jgi:hypothetical protein
MGCSENQSDAFKGIKRFSNSSETISSFLLYTRLKVGTPYAEREVVDREPTNVAVKTRSCCLLSMIEWSNNCFKRFMLLLNFVVTRNGKIEYAESEQEENKLSGYAGC